MDVWSVNLRRMHAWQNNRAYLSTDASRRSASAIRITGRSGMERPRAASRRACCTIGSLRPAPVSASRLAGSARTGTRSPGETPEYAYSWQRQNWFVHNAAEHRAVRERVGIFEQSSFAKLLVQGRDAAALLNRIATANVDVRIGRCVYTQFLNTAGGIEADLTVTRLAADRFLVVTAAFTQTHVEAWIRNQIPAGAYCVVTDVTEAYVMLNVQGPASRALLQSLSPDDFSPAGFPFATCRDVRIGYQTLLAIRLTYVGELGWELYIPTSFALPVYDAIVAAARRMA
jgi:heterotetrameric sarcosine oxidase gamma subunit